jgi:uncharacterized membrane protein
LGLGCIRVIASGQIEESGEFRIVLKPNASLSWRHLALLMGFLALIMTAISVSFALAGAWLVLPFSGGEWLMLGWCFYLSMRKSSIQEVITISDALVQLDRGRSRPEQTYRFQRTWLVVELARAHRRGHPSRLTFRLHGKMVEVGEFLVESEREELAQELKGYLKFDIDERPRYQEEERAQ